MTKKIFSVSIYVNLKTEKSMNKTRTIIFSALFIAITAVLAQIILPLPFTPVPVNFALVGVMLSGIILGSKKGALCQFIYILLGMAGLPIFAGFSGGIGKVLGPTGGYLLSYPVVSFLCGKYIEIFGRKFSNFIISTVVSLILCYIVSTIWIMFLMKLTFVSAVTIGVLPFIIGDLLKIFVLVFIAQAIYKRKDFTF